VPVNVADLWPAWGPSKYQQSIVEIITKTWLPLPNGICMARSWNWITHSRFIDDVDGPHSFSYLLWVCCGLSWPLFTAIHELPRRLGHSKLVSVTFKIVMLE